jgi:hypothetical protein
MPQILAPATLFWNEPDRILKNENRCNLGEHE